MPQMKAGSGRLAVSVMGCLHRYLNGFGGGREKWTQYRWFFCTTEIRDIPQGKWGSFIILAGKLKPAWEGYYFVATSATKKELQNWHGWHCIKGMSHNRTPSKVPTNLMEKHLGSDPKVWIERQSSKNPADWIEVGKWKQSLGHERVNARHHQIVELLHSGKNWNVIQHEMSLSLHIIRTHKRRYLAELEEAENRKIMVDK